MTHKGTVTLETERLILRRYRIEDVEEAYRNWMSSKVVTRFLTWTPHASVEESREYIQSVLDSYANDNIYNWVMELKETGEVIGSIGVNRLKEDIASCEIGYCMSESCWGKGIMAEAFREVIRFLFTEVGVNRIESNHDVNNPASGRVMEKCGLRYEGTLRQADRNNQGVCDSIYRAILREEYLGTIDN